MADGVNKVILLGNLGRDPELRHTGNGTPVANINVATSRSWKDKTTGEKQEQVEWHRVIAWARLAEVCAEYLRKGSKVYFEGRLQTRKWQDDNGQDRQTTEIVAEEMKMLGGGQGGGQDQSAPARGAGQGQGQGQAQGGGGAHQPDFDQDFEDDIPF